MAVMTLATLLFALLAAGLVAAIFYFVGLRAGERLGRDQTRSELKDIARAAADQSNQQAREAYERATGQAVARLEIAARSDRELGQEQFAKTPLRCATPLARSGGWRANSRKSAPATTERLRRSRSDCRRRWRRSSVAARRAAGAQGRSPGPRPVGRDPAPEPRRARGTHPALRLPKSRKGTTGRGPTWSCACPGKRAFPWIPNSPGTTT